MSKLIGNQEFNGKVWIKDVGGYDGTNPPTSYNDVVTAFGLVDSRIDGKYSKPYGGIPESDLTQDLQNAIKPLETPTRYGTIDIAPGCAIYMTGVSSDSDWIIGSYSNSDSYGTLSGLTNRSTYFTWDECVNAGIEDLGFRLPTKEEFEKVFTTDSNVRPGSKYNSRNGSHWAIIQLTGVTIAGQSTPYGILIFPDNKTITGRTLNSFDEGGLTSGITEAELNSFISQGCAFMPFLGYVQNGSWQNSTHARFWTSTPSSSDTTRAYCVTLNASSPSPIVFSQSNKTTFSLPIYLVKDGGKSLVERVDELESNSGLTALSASVVDNKDAISAITGDINVLSAIIEDNEFVIAQAINSLNDRAGAVEDDVDLIKDAISVTQNKDVYVYGIGGYNGTNPASASTLQEVIGDIETLLSQI